MTLMESMGWCAYAIIPTFKRDIFALRMLFVCEPFYNVDQQPFTDSNISIAISVEMNKGKRWSWSENAMQYSLLHRGYIKDGLNIVMIKLRNVVCDWVSGESGSRNFFLMEFCSEKSLFPLLKCSIVFCITICVEWIFKSHMYLLQ